MNETCWEIRYWLAKRNDMPIPALMKLTKDTHKNVRESAASNPLISRESLSLWAKSKDIALKCGVALNPKTPVHILRILAKDKSIEVRQALARNPKTPEKNIMETV